MDSCDALVVEFLAAHAGFRSQQVAHLCDWWQSTREPDEALAAFLLRQRLLSEPTVRIFAQISNKHLTSALGSALLDRRELESLRQRLPDVALLEHENEMPATVTLLSGHDTWKDTHEPRAAAPPLADPPPHVGMTLGKYLLSEWLGEGASGAVFRSLHPTLHIPVAVKVLHDCEGPDRAERHRRLRAEARLLARLNHPNILRIYDFEQEARHPHLVLEFANGPSLAELIECSGRVQPDRAIRILRQLADALAAAHKIGIIHRDLKPANVLLTREGHVKLADLGLATVRHPAVRGDGGLHLANARVGTVLYIAPELVGTARPADELSDIYSLGATFFHALTGVPPFQGENAWQVISQHARTPAPSPRQLVPDLPIELADLIVRMLAKDPAARPASFADLLDEPALKNSAPRRPGPADFASVPVDGTIEPLTQPLWRRLVEKIRRGTLEAEAFLF